MSETQNTPLTADELEALRNTLIAQSSAPTVSIGPKAESEIQMLRKQRNALIAACEGLLGLCSTLLRLNEGSPYAPENNGYIQSARYAIALAKPKGGE